MNKIIDKTPVCEPIDRLLKELEEKKIIIIEQRLRDYHFAEFYFKAQGDLFDIGDLNLNGFSKKDNYLFCDCHWSTVELCSAQLDV